MITAEQKEIRKARFDEMEQRLTANKKPEDRMFYYHSSEDRIVLSHALFWVMTQSFRGPLSKSKHFLLMRQYEEEMLEAYLTEDEYFPELLRYCNIMYEVMPIIFSSLRDSRNDKAVRRLLAIGIVAGGYGGDCKEEICNELIDDIDFHFNRVKCRKIESLLPLLNDYVADEIHQMR